jgi:HEPN domain-containing protein
LARKAEGDDKALRLLAPNAEIDDETIGFHAQQAVEKRLKAVLAANDVRFEPKHSLARLLELLGGAGIEAPPGADWLDELTIYAVPMRYEQFLDAEPLDREATVRLVDEVGDWAGRLINA